MSDNNTENLGSKSPGTQLREGLAVWTEDIGKKEEMSNETESAGAEREALKAQRTNNHGSKDHEVH
jgi:hypothetical protein